ncbi:MAG: hypothetical protein GVX96_03820 [Bacteroidetes bacterium]|jgi:hypothetical protein|nr:hypothetical protein [Bacteroidota bacterium]
MKYAILICCLFMLFGCAEEENEPPTDEKTMLFVLRDMMLIESRVSLLKDEVRDSVKSELNVVLLQQYNWTEEDLEAFETYLSQHPELSVKLHDQVRSELKKLENEL